MGGTRKPAGPRAEGRGQPEGLGRGAEREVGPRESAVRTAALSPALYPRPAASCSCPPHHAARRAVLCAAALRRVAGRGEEPVGHIGSSSGVPRAPGAGLQPASPPPFASVAAGQATGREGGWDHPHVLGTSPPLHFSVPVFCFWELPPLFLSPRREKSG